MWSGVLTGNPGPSAVATTATGQQNQEELENQQFWNNVWSQFNPQSNVQSTPTTAPALNNVANTAQGILKSNLGNGPTGSTDIGQAGQNLRQSDTGASKTEDINNFMNNFNANNKSAEQRELSMFGNTQGTNNANAELYQGAPAEGQIKNAETQNENNTMWQQYEQGLPNPLNEIVGSAGGAFGTIGGKAASQRLFGNTGTTNNNDNDAEYNS